MPFIPAAQTAKITAQGVVDGQLTVNDLYFQNSAAVTTFNLSSLVGGVKDWFEGTLAPLLSHDWSTLRVVGIDLSAINSFRIEVSSTVLGGVGTEAVPNNVAACISLRTGNSGRSARGRNYIPSIPNASVTLNTMDPTLISDLETAYASMVGAGTFVAGWQWCVVSFVHLGAPRAAGLVQPVTNVLFTKPTVSSMRTREVGKGI